MQKSYFNFCPSEAWTPSVNLYETGTTYLVCVDLAGVEKEKIDLEVVDNRLRLQGHRHVPAYDFQGEHEAEESAGTAAHGAAARTATGSDQAIQSPPRRVRVHLMEIDHGGFCRDVELPEDVDREKIRAHYRDGILWIEIPKG